MSETHPVATAPPDAPAAPDAAGTTAPSNRRGWKAAGAAALVAVLLVAAVAITALVVDSDDDDRETTLVIDARDVITSERAAQLGVQAVGGGTVTEIQLDGEDGRLVYEVEVSDPARPGVDIDVVVDARTGDVLATDR